MNGQQSEVATVPKVEAHVKITERGMAPDSLDGLWRVATLVSQSGLAPKGMERPQSLCIAMAMGAEIGLTPMQAIQSVAVINGRPAVWGDAMLALCLPHLAEFSERFEGDGDDFAAVCRCVRKGSKIVIEQPFSVLDAKEAKLWGKSGPWQQYRRRMLQMRARGFALRDSCADILRGVISREEAIDLPPSEYTVTEIADAIAGAPPRVEATAEPEPGAEEQDEHENEADDGSAPRKF